MTTCPVCYDEHDGDGELCSRCARFSDYWRSLTPDQQRREQRSMDNYADDLRAEYGDGQ